MTEENLSPAALPFWSRVLGVITSPRETFASIVAHPRWLGVLVLTTLVGAGTFAAFVATPVGEQAVFDEYSRQQEQSGQQLSSDQQAAFEQSAPVLKYLMPAAVLVFAPIFAFLIAALLFGYGAILGGAGTYKQMLAIWTHAQVVTLLQAIVVHPLNYVRRSVTTATNLTAFFPMIPVDSFIGRVFGWVELFMLWQIILAAIGLSVLYRRRTGPIAWALLGIYFAIAIVVALFQSYTAGA